MTELQLEHAHLTDVGQKRQQNADYVGCFEPDNRKALATSGRVYIVADGVGVGRGGDVASEYAVKKTLATYYASTEPDLGERLQNALRSTHADLYNWAEENEDLRRMATTIVVALVHHDDLIIAHVGDSRAYLIHHGNQRQLTRDHSLVAQLVDEGSITAEEAENHPRRNIVLRSLGVDSEVHADLYRGKLEPGDYLLLCSDGLTRHVSDYEIFATVTRYRPQRAVRDLVALANQRGGGDNISVWLLRCAEAVPLSALARRRPKKEVPQAPTIDDLMVAALERRKVPPPKTEEPIWPWLAIATAVGLFILLSIIFIKFLWYLSPWGWLTMGLGGAVTVAVSFLIVWLQQ